jgi:8-oxo-dGTP diphosphatase
MKKTGAWAIIYCPHEESLLLGRRSSEVNNAGMWNYFGGQIDEIEPPASAFARELFEETGMKLSASQVISQSGQAYRDLGCILGKDDRCFHYYLVLVNEEFTPDLNDEHDMFFWFNLRHLPKHVNRPTRMAKQLQLKHKDYIAHSDRDVAVDGMVTELPFDI